eukprot:scaffold3753_cov127-Isochrysis_galbana.AAC.3
MKLASMTIPCWVRRVRSRHAAMADLIDNTHRKLTHLAPRLAEAPRCATQRDCQKIVISGEYEQREGTTTRNSSKYDASQEG